MADTIDDDAPAPARGSLAGLKILDLTRMLAGPFATMVLADQGAEVVKLEPLDGDGTRGFGPFLPEDEAHEFGGYFQSVNRNKQSLALDLRAPAGRDLFLRLVEGADVVVENFRPGVMDRLGLSYETLAARNPRLVYAAVRGFGDPRSGRSPYNDWPAYDVVAQAMGGAMGITGPDAAHPTKVGPGIGDTVPALFLCIGILSAVRQAEKTGRGQMVDVAMYDAIVALCERMIYQHAYSGAIPGPEGNGHPLFCPFGLFPAADGWISIGCPQDSFWVALCDCFGRPELAADPRYATTPARNARRQEVEAMVAGWTGPLSKQELKERLGGRVPLGPLNTAADVFADPHIAVRNMLATIALPELGREVTVANTPIRYSGATAGVRRRAPKLGEDSRAILRRAGVEGAEIDRLLAEKVIGAG